METPLFVPLKARYFRAFLDGTKRTEYRRHGPRWNRRVCRVGRRVTLSLGYGKQHRACGVIVAFRLMPLEVSAGRLDYWACYGGSGGDIVAEIDIAVDGVTPRAPEGVES